MLSSELNVTVIPDYARVPGEALEDVDNNEFTAGTVLTLTCKVLGASGTLTYSWSVQGNPPPPSTCTHCEIILNEMVNVTINPLLSFHAGTYTCTASVSGMPGGEKNASYTVKVVGEYHGILTCMCMSCRGTSGLLCRCWDTCSYCSPSV